MKTLRFDSVGGASGDMVLAALVDLGAPVEVIREQLARLLTEDFALEAAACTSHHLHGTRVTVRVEDAPHGHADHGHHGRRLADVRALLERGALSERVRQQGADVFQRLAEAEGHIHGVPVDQVHFHEVGALDSIIDVVGACVALELLEVERVSVGPLPLGCGTIVCAHGTFPAPAPATLELLKGVPVLQTTEPHELVTPTGAALLVSWRGRDDAPVGGTIRGVGHGFGHRELTSRPNLLRATLLETVEEPDEDSCRVLECTVDDTTPELLGVALDKLLAAGAREAFLTPVQMKKQRPGLLLTVLCAAEQEETMLDLVFRETTTLGVRRATVDRAVLPRHHEEVVTPYGVVRIKVGQWRGNDVTRAPELEDCRKRAEECGVAVREVYEAALTAARTRRGPG